jgi:outer membrane protein assembly factor BamD (BamD/ComL family)
MKKIVSRFPLLLLAALLALSALAACKTAPVVISPDLSPADLFQKAQEASDAGKYDLALRYYETFQERHPDDLEHNLWARYEIALLRHKMGDDQTAVQLLDELLALYAGEDAKDLPPAPRILAEKIKAKITSAEPAKP